MLEHLLKISRDEGFEAALEQWSKEVAVLEAIYKEYQETCCFLSSESLRSTEPTPDGYHPRVRDLVWAEFEQQANGEYHCLCQADLSRHGVMYTIDAVHSMLGSQFRDTEVKAGYIYRA